ncbi:MAG: c-type cytochrome, partial [Chitinophagaceae bacterium]|nr:c-type cytochrome [Chitinophagaceae bacterium]
SPSQDTLTLNPIKRLELDSSGRLSKVTVVAQGFANPVMGLDIYRNKLYATCLNELFSMDIEPDGSLSNKQVLVRDAADPWNPFGMYRVAVGPDAKLWLAMADHPDSKPVTLTGSDGSRIRLRGQSGGFVRCNLDGSDLQLVVQGFRAPFAFDFDPWGHLWAISNGESSPNIYVDVIPGMDYGYHSRQVSYAWLAGKTPLSPPVTEMGSGANTVAMHYYSSMFPSDPYWGSILIANWGSHGAFPTNRTVKQYLPQAAPLPDSMPSLGGLFKAATSTFITSSDSMFRPVGMTYAPDGGLYLADWHGRDDESDATGRIFKLTHVGHTKKSALYNPEAIARADIQQLCKLLVNPNKFIRADAREYLVNAGAGAIPQLEQLIEKGNAFQSAQSIWTLSEIQDSPAAKALTAGLTHKDARIRALTIRLLRQASGEAIGGRFFDEADSSGNRGRRKVLFDPAELSTLTSPMLQDPDPEVRIEAALSQQSIKDLQRGLVNALSIASSKRHRYQIGFELGRYCDAETISSLHDTTQPVHYKIALIAAQTALTEKTAIAELVKDWDLTTGEDMGKELIAQIESGNKFPEHAAERITALNWLEANPRTPNADLVKFLQACLNDSLEYLVKGAAYQVARQKLLQTDTIQQTVLDILQSPGSAFPFLRQELLYTAGSFSRQENTRIWKDMFNDSTEAAILTALRALREQKREPAFINEIWTEGLNAAKRFPGLAEEFQFAFKTAGLDEQRLKQLPAAPQRPLHKEELSKKILSDLPKGSARRGKWTYTQTCLVCHSHKTDDETFRLGPNLSTIGASSQPSYLIESILEPSKVLKTGYQVETIDTKDGKSYSGQTETKGNELIIRNNGKEPVVIPMNQINKRATSHISPMPEGLYHDMTIREMADLIAYLLSLKGSN